ncbi:MAG: hypothetical protein AB7N65_30860 [Vicinamibacterales bacterium]
MKAIFGAALLASTSALAADVGVSITLGQPGFYGQINIGNDLVPRLVIPQPVIVTPPQPGVVLAPMYLRVPPGHRKKWGAYCGQYGACGRQVYFVDDDWYEQEYVSHYRQHPERYRGDHDHHGHGKRGGHAKGHGGGDGKGNGKGRGRD